MAERSGRSEWEELHCRTCRAPACAPVPCPVDLGASRSERKLGSSMQTERPSWSQPRIAESCVRGAPFPNTPYNCTYISYPFWAGILAFYKRRFAGSTSPG